MKTALRPVPHPKPAKANMADLVSRVRMAGSAANVAPYASGAPEFWSVVDGYEYALHDVRTVTPDWVSGLRAAAADAWLVFSKVANVAFHLEPEALLEMGFPEASLPLLGVSFADLPTVFGRFDFIESADGFKVIEFNAETPFFFIETHHVNGLACAHAGVNDPNADAERDVLQTMQAASKLFRPYAQLAVVASNVYREDYFTAQYLASLWEITLQQPVRVVPIHELSAGPDGLVANGTRIDVLHRCYPLEYMAADAGGRFLQSIVTEGHTLLINPPAALFLQNKLTQALIWGLYERNEFFDEVERAAIARTFLPSYADLPDGSTWVRKPALGREGSAIAIVENGQVVEETAGRAYTSQPVMYQAFVESPRVNIRLSTGETKDGFAVATCAITGGNPSAVGMRVGSRITDGWAHFAPIGFARV